MKYLIIDKKQRISSSKKHTTATLRIMEELGKKNVDFDFLLMDDIEIIFQNSKLKILGNGIDLSSYSHILFRGHSLGNHKEYETKRLVIDYIEQTNYPEGEKKPLIQNAQSYKVMPYYNKIWMAHICSQNNIPYFDSYYRLDGNYTVKRDFLEKFPLIIKEYHGENDIRIIDGEEKIKKNVYKIDKPEDYKQEFLNEKDFKNYFIQEYCDTGEDMRIFLSKGKVVGGWKRKARKGFMTVSQGEYTMYNNPSQEIKELAQKTAKAFKADFIAADFMFKQDKPYLQEISLNPGFKAYEEKAVGDEPANIAKYIIESF